MNNNNTNYVQSLLQLFIKAVFFYLVQINIY